MSMKLSKKLLIRREWRPAHFFFAHNVCMEMKNGLSRFFSRIYNQTKSVLFQPLHFRYLLYDKKEICKLLINRRCHFQYIIDMDLGYDKDMYRCARLYILKCKPMFIFINLCARNFSGNNFTKQAVFHFIPSFLQFRSNRLLLKNEF